MDREAFLAFKEEESFLEATELILKLLEEKRLTQKELATRAGQDSADLSNILKGKRDLTLKDLVKYLFHLGYELRIDARQINAYGL